jgi:hypothetical protein
MFSLQVKEVSCVESHSLIEELMVMTNTYIAKRLSRRPACQSLMIIRCHQAPTWEELGAWLEKEGGVSELVMQLQGKSVTPTTRLSFQNAARGGGGGGGGQRQDTVVVQSEVGI